MSEPTTAAGYFTAMIQEYDSLIRRAVPSYDEMQDRLVAYLPDGPARTLELGCGTGALTLQLARARPDWRITTVDASEEMVALTRSRLGRVPAATERFAFVAARFEDLSLEAGTFDVVVSSISLHHVVDKAALFRVVRRALTQQGTFRFSDQLDGGGRGNHDVNWQAWLDYCRRPGNCSEAELASLIEHSRVHDHYASLDQHFRLLRDAGFGQVDCVWRDGMWGVITADV